MLKNHDVKASLKLLVEFEEKKISSLKKSQNKVMLSGLHNIFKPMAQQ